MRRHNVSTWRRGEPGCRLCHACRMCLACVQMHSYPKQQRHVHGNRSSALWSRPSFKQHLSFIPLLPFAAVAATPNAQHHYTCHSTNRDDRALIPLTLPFAFADRGHIDISLKDVKMYRRHDKVGGCLFVEHTRKRMRVWNGVCVWGVCVRDVLLRLVKAAARETALSNLRQAWVRGYGCCQSAIGDGSRRSSRIIFLPPPTHVNVITTNHSLTHSAPPSHYTTHISPYLSTRSRRTTHLPTLAFSCPAGTHKQRSTATFWRENACCRTRSTSCLRLRTERCVCLQTIVVLSPWRMPLGAKTAVC